MSLLLKSILKIGVPVVLTTAAYLALKVKEQNSPAKEKPHSDAPIIVALGDSITFGSGVAKTRSTDTWEYKLEQMLRGQYQILNYGISGATLQNEGDKPYWNMPEASLQDFPASALSLNPEIVILMLGTNDSKPYNWNHQRFADQMNMRLAQLKSFPSIKRLIVMCPPYACPADGADIVSYDIFNETIRDEIRPIVKKCAAENSVECIDLFEITNGHPEFYADGVHPNSLGNYMIAKCIYNHISGK